MNRHLIFCICSQGNEARKVDCCCKFSAYILKPVLSGGVFVNENLCQFNFSVQGE